jgi:hypothetical protein
MPVAASADCGFYNATIVSVEDVYYEDPGYNYIQVWYSDGLGNMNFCEFNTWLPAPTGSVASYSNASGVVRVELVWNGEVKTITTNCPNH